MLIPAPSTARQISNCGIDTAPVISGIHATVTIADDVLPTGRTMARLDVWGGTHNLSELSFANRLASCESRHTLLGLRDDPLDDRLPLHPTHLVTIFFLSGERTFFSSHRS